MCEEYWAKLNQKKRCKVMELRSAVAFRTNQPEENEAGGSETSQNLHAVYS